jgi:uncharacterized protein (TIGR03083 family)
VTKAAISALRAEHTHALELFDSLTAEEWQRPSGCAGWRVQDVAQHMAATFHSIADPTSIEAGTSGDVEQNAEVPVQARRDWTAEQVMAEYREWSERGIAALDAMQEPPTADMVIPIGNLGSHPLHIMGNAIAFDHYCHLRHDIGMAVPRAADLPHDPAVLEPTIEWMMAGIPQMCAEALERCEHGVNFVFTDLRHTVYHLRRSVGSGPWEVGIGADPSLPICVTSAHEFVNWATKRSDWRDHVQLTDQASAPTLDAINVI